MMDGWDMRRRIRDEGSEGCEDCGGVGDGGECGVDINLIKG